jgi:hypothetical protein
MHHPPNHSATLIKKIHSTIPPFHPHLPHSTNQLPTEKTKKQKNTPPSHNCDPWTPFHAHLPHSTNQLPTEKRKKEKKEKKKKTPRLHTTATLRIELTNLNANDESRDWVDWTGESLDWASAGIAVVVETRMVAE